MLSSASSSQRSRHDARRCLPLSSATMHRAVSLAAKARRMDYYRILQVTRDAEPAVIDRAYKALSMAYHPDRVAPGERTRATRRMQRINEAYSVLSDPRRRAEYDLTLPAEGAAAWDRFWEVGLVGLFVDRYGRHW